ncbi:MAG: RidA family protein [Candidatus Kapabacteria bacterium]|jgi:2-aminomuconate deaminase|nr:RidA family protein [Candidatus Kapabacteria bacterium]
MSAFNTDERPDVINSPLAAEPVGAYPHARRVGNLLFLSGIGPRERGQKAIPGVTLAEDGTIESYDIKAQTLSVFRNIKHILDAAGSKWENIVDVHVFLTNMKQDFPVFNALYAEHFTHVQATRTTIQIDCLPTPIAVELKIIATID